MKSLCVALALLCGASLASAADSPLVNAVKRQDVATVRVLLRQKVNVNHPEPDGATALHWAASRNAPDIARLLVGAGAKVDAANDYGVTPLSLACENGADAMVDLLLKAGANPNLPLPSGETPLMTASRSGNLAAVTHLLAKGANVNATEPTAGQTALLWALSEQHLPIVNALIDHGAHVKQAALSGFTPLMMAVRFGNLEATTLLLAKGAGINDTAEDGVSVLQVAVLRGHASLAMYLLDHGADPNIDKAGYTALHWAAGTWESTMTFDYPNTPDPEWRYLRGVPDHKLDLIKALLAHGADINARMTKSPPRYGINLFFGQLSGATPFWLAALGADIDVMRLLVANGADPTLMTNDRTTPLIVAAGMARSSGDTRINDEDSIAPVEFCLSLGIDINAANNAGETALHATAYANYPKVAQLLLERGAAVNVKNRRGDTPTRVADSFQQAAMVFYRPQVAALLRKYGGKAE